MEVAAGDSDELVADAMTDVILDKILLTLPDGMILLKLPDDEGIDDKLLDMMEVGIMLSVAILVGTVVADILLY